MAAARAQQPRRPSRQAAWPKKRGQNSVLTANKLVPAWAWGILVAAAILQQFITYATTPPASAGLVSLPGARLRAAHQVPKMPQKTENDS